MFYKPKKAALVLISTKDYFNLIGLHESEPIIYGLQGGALNVLK